MDSSFSAYKSRGTALIVYSFHQMVRSQIRFLESNDLLTKASSLIDKEIMIGGFKFCDCCFFILQAPLRSHITPFHGCMLVNTTYSYRIHQLCVKYRPIILCFGLACCLKFIFKRLICSCSIFCMLSDVAFCSAWSAITGISVVGSISNYLGLNGTFILNNLFL